MSSRVLLVASSLLFASACHATDREPANASVASQTDHGAKVFAQSCAKCHGNAGQGGEKAPRLVGKDALPLDPRPGQKRTQRFHTVLDVANFATHNMPPDEDQRAKLTERDYWAVLAFDLKANGIELKRPLDAKLASEIVLHP